MIGCQTGACASDDPRDHRDRPSALVRYPDPTMTPDEHAAAFNAKQAGHRQFIIDTSPELRQQAIREKLSRIDGVLFTHGHADHIFGMDDLRRFNAVMKAPIDIYAEAGVIDLLQGMFRYIFEPHTNVNQSFVADLIAHRIEVERPLELFGAMWTPLRLLHGRLPILGFRVDFRGASLAYCTDVSNIPPQTFPHLDGLDVLVLDALRYRHHPTHLTVDQAVRLAEQIRARQTYFTHIAHDIIHAELDPQLPAGINLAYDGLAVEISDGE
jgi:phosphoribosyl 1,2-cyclic phosphate phosphodiesterase